MRKLFIICARGMGGIQTGMGNTDKASSLRGRVAGCEVSETRFESGNLLTALVRRRLFAR